MLRYRAVTADYAYRDREPVLIDGNIGLVRAGRSENAFLSLQIRVRDLRRETPVSRPVFAYLKTGSASTVEVRNPARDLDDGFRLFGFGWIEPTTTVLMEMLEEAKVTVAFNRTEGGMELAVPLDLRVYEAEPLPGGSYRRKWSDEAIDHFRHCVDAILNGAL
jgi:hypothetical protein